MDLSLSDTSVDEHTVVEVRGEVDVHTAPDLLRHLTKLLDSGAKAIAVDMTTLGFIDSTGLGALVAARNHAQETGAAVALVFTSDRLTRLFRITGLHDVFSIYPTVAEAVAAA